MAFEKGTRSCHPESSALTLHLSVGPLNPVPSQHNRKSVIQIHLGYQPSQYCSVQVHQLLSFQSRFIVRTGSNQGDETYPLGLLEFQDQSNFINFGQWATDAPSWGHWVWKLSADDLWLMHRICGSQKDDVHPIFQCWGSAIVSSETSTNDDSTELATFTAEGWLRIPASDWAKIAETTTILPAKVPMPIFSGFDLQTLEDRFKELQDARRALGEGRGHDAVAKCFDVLTNVAETIGEEPSPPIFLSNTWKRVLEKLDEKPNQRIIDKKWRDRQGALQDLLYGISSVCNTLGHHAGQQSDPNGHPTDESLDQWEADVFVTMAYLAVYYLQQRQSNQNQKRSH